jgi:hypothetical protein
MTAEFHAVRESEKNLTQMRKWRWQQRNLHEKSAQKSSDQSAAKSQRVRIKSPHPLSRLAMNLTTMTLGVRIVMTLMLVRHKKFQFAMDSEVENTSPKLHNPMRQHAQ